MEKKNGNFLSAIYATSGSGLYTGTNWHECIKLFFCNQLKLLHNEAVFCCFFSNSISHCTHIHLMDIGTFIVYAM